MDKITNESECPNCGDLLGKDYQFCPSCGQKILKPSDFTIRHMVFDSIADYFHFDGKFFQSLVPLLFKPGKLTEEYLLGKRSRFVAPFKLVLFISVVYFIIVGMTFKMEFAAPKPKNSQGMADSIIKQNPKNPLDLYITYAGRAMSLDSVQTAVREKGIDAFVDEMDPTASWLSRTIAFQVVNFAVQGPEVFLKKMVHNASKVIFVLIPFVALLFKLIYVRKNRLYYDHLIFSLHFHAFLFIVLLIYQLIGFWLFSIPVWILLLIVLFYLLLAMKRVYKQRWMLTFLKMISMVLMYLVIALPVFAFLLLAISVML